MAQKSKGVSFLKKIYENKSNTDDSKPNSRPSSKAGSKFSRHKPQKEQEESQRSAPDQPESRLNEVKSDKSKHLFAADHETEETLDSSISQVPTPLENYIPQGCHSPKTAASEKQTHPADDQQQRKEPETLEAGRGLKGGAKPPIKPTAQPQCTDISQEKVASTTTKSTKLDNTTILQKSVQCHICGNINSEECRKCSKSLSSQVQQPKSSKEKASDLNEIDDDTNLLRFMKEIKLNNKTVQFQHIKIFLTGSAAAGKTSFRRLLLKTPFTESYTSTEMLQTKQACVVNNASSMGSPEGIVWYDLTGTQKLSHIKSVIKFQKSKYEKSASQSNSDHNNVQNMPSELEQTILEAAEIPEDYTISNTVKLITIVDTGGQPEYIQLLPAIVTHSEKISTINFIVHDMTKDLDSAVLVRYNKQGHEEIKPHNLTFSNKDLIKMLISVLVDSSSTANKGNSKPYICFIGTHKDKATHDEMPKLKKQLNDIVGDSNVEILTTEDNKFLHAVDNTTAGEGEDAIVKNIRNKIDSKLCRQGCDSIPINWIFLELKLQKIPYAENISYITYDRYVSLAMEQELKSDEDIKRSLQYFHSLNVLLHFKDVQGLRDYVIIDQQWLYNKLATLVNIQCRSFTGLGFHSQTRFRKSGVIEKCEITYAIEWEDKGSIKVEHFVALLVHKRIIANYAVENEEFYYFPYILPYCQQYTDRHKFLVSEPLLIQFSSGFLPIGFFCSLVVHLIQNPPLGWKHQLSPHTEDSENFRNIMTFLLPDEYYLRMLDKTHYLELQIRHYKNCSLNDATEHSKVYGILRDYMRSVCQKLKFDFNKLQYGFLCHDGRSNDDHIAVPRSIDTPSKIPNVIMCCRGCKNPTKIGLLHKCWFEVADYISEINYSCPMQNIMMNDDLEMSQIVNIVIPQVQSDWVDIAYSLKFKIEDVKVIKENHREDTKKCCRQLFEDWLRTDCGITPKTWSTLLHCLKNLHLSKAADEIEKELGLISAAKKSKNQARTVESTTSHSTKEQVPTTTPNASECLASTSCNNDPPSIDNITTNKESGENLKESVPPLIKPRKKRDNIPNSFGGQKTLEKKHSDKGRQDSPDDETAESTTNSHKNVSSTTNMEGQGCRFPSSTERTSGSHSTFKECSTSRPTQQKQSHQDAPVQNTIGKLDKNLLERFDKKQTGPHSAEKFTESGSRYRNPTSTTAFNSNVPAFNSQETHSKQKDPTYKSTSTLPNAPNKSSSHRATASDQKADEAQQKQWRDDNSKVKQQVASQKRGNWNKQHFNRDGISANHKLAEIFMEHQNSKPYTL